MTRRARQDQYGLSSLPAKGPHEGLTASDLVGQAAHDLRQPVAAIVALAAAAMAETEVPRQLRRRLEQITDQASWMSKIISGLLTPDDGIFAGERAEVSALVREVVAAERLTYPGCILLRQANEKPRYVEGNAMRLRRALANVLANATRAAGPDGRVELTQRSRTGVEVVEIVDDGPGFGGVTPGHGIGLRAARQVLAQCGGWIEHERLASHQTLMRLLLPIASGHPKAGVQ